MWRSCLCLTVSFTARSNYVCWFIFLILSLDDSICQTSQIKKKIKGKVQIWIFFSSIQSSSNQNDCLPFESSDRSFVVTTCPNDPLSLFLITQTQTHSKMIFIPSFNFEILEAWNRLTESPFVQSCGWFIIRHWASPQRYVTVFKLNIQMTSEVTANKTLSISPDPFEWSKILHLFIKLLKRWCPLVAPVAVAWVRFQPGRSSLFFPYIICE